MKSKSRRDIILEVYDREAMGEVGAQEIELMIAELGSALGPGGVLEPAEVARILTDEGLPVRLDEVFSMTSRDEEYEQLFDGIVHIDSLEEAEQTIQHIDNVFRAFRDQKDERGMRFARQVAMSAKSAALASSDKSSIGIEISEWFAIWLQTPDIFRDWLEVRKASMSLQ